MRDRRSEFMYMLKMVSKNLCHSIYNFITYHEDNNFQYTKDSIRSYMLAGFKKVQEKHPLIKDDVLDKCIDFCIKKMDSEKGLWLYRDNSVNEERLDAIIREEIEKTAHFVKDRGSRSDAIEEIGGYGNSVCKRVVDRGHPDGPEIFVLTDNAIIKVYNANTLRHVTDLIARPEQIVDRLGSALATLDRNLMTKIFNLARMHQERGYNNR